MDLTLKYEDMLYICNSKELKLLNFKAECIETIKYRLKRDLAFLTENDVTNFSIQLIVERNKDRINEIGPNSFLSVDGLYIYHFCVSDFTETYTTKGYIQRKMTLEPCQYADKMFKFMSRHVLIQ